MTFLIIQKRSHYLKYLEIIYLLKQVNNQLLRMSIKIFGEDDLR